MTLPLSFVICFDLDAGGAWNDFELGTSVKTMFLLSALGIIDTIIKQHSFSISYSLNSGGINTFIY